MINVHGSQCSHDKEGIYYLKKANAHFVNSEAYTRRSKKTCEHCEHVNKVLRTLINTRFLLFTVIKNQVNKSEHC